MKNICIRSVLMACLVLAIAHVSAEPFPARPVRIIVGNAPGGGTDIAARIIAQKLTSMWGQSVIVDNRPGASGIIGAQFVARAPADGYTLLLASQTTTAMASNLYPKLPYDVLKDFKIITIVGAVPLVLVTNPSLPAKTFQEFSTYAKANQASLNFGSAGVGSTQHLAGEQLNLALGVKIKHIPYKGESPAMVDVVAGQLPYTFVTLTSAMPQIKSGSLRGIGIASLKRSGTAPELPTIAESGIPGFEMAPWYGLYGPSGMSKELTAQINADVVKALASPEVRQQLMQQGFDVNGDSQEDAAAYLRAETIKYGKLFKDANVTLEQN